MGDAGGSEVLSDDPADAGDGGDIADAGDAGDAGDDGDLDGAADGDGGDGGDIADDGADDILSDDPGDADADADEPLADDPGADDGGSGGGSPTGFFSGFTSFFSRTFPDYDEDEDEDDESNFLYPVKKRTRRSVPRVFRSSSRDPRQFFSYCNDRITLPCIIEDFIGTGLGSVPTCQPIHCGNSLCPVGQAPCRVETSVTPFALGVHFGEGLNKGSPEDNIGACLRYSQLPCL